jgi:nucleoid-associated protein YgaU
MAAIYAAPAVPSLGMALRRPQVTAGPARQGRLGRPAGPARQGRLGRPAGPLRMTRRGRVVVLAIALLIVLLPGAWRAMATAQVEGPATVAVTVQPGDTLWGIASSVDPGTDPRGLIAEIREANGLARSGLVPGQVLHIPVR